MHRQYRKGTTGSLHQAGAHGRAAHDGAAFKRGAHDHGPGGHALSGHSHAPLSFGASFAIAIGLNATIVVGEAGVGVVAHSVALLADAGHNLSDVLGLCAAFAATRLGQRAPFGRFTYGLGGTSILAALGNALLLLIVTGGLILEALQRFIAPETMSTAPVMAVAAAAIVVNATSAWLLSAGGSGDLNRRAAAAHLAADAAAAAGVLVAAALIAWTGWLWIDPAVSLAIAAVIVVGTWHLLREATALSLAAVPAAIEPDAVRGFLRGLPGVTDIHDLHIWAMSTSETALTAHLVMPAGHPGDDFLMEACRVLRETHGIGHATMQIETNPATVCALAPGHLV